MIFLLLQKKLFTIPFCNIRLSFVKLTPSIKDHLEILILKANFSFHIDLFIGNVILLLIINREKRTCLVKNHLMEYFWLNQLQYATFVTSSFHSSNLLRTNTLRKVMLIGVWSRDWTTEMCFL